MTYLAILTFLLFALTAAQNDTLSNLSLSEGSPAFKALFNPAVAGLEASLAIRFLYIQAIANYEIEAACHPAALSFFGTKDSILQELCSPVNCAVIRAYILFRINRQQYPVEAGRYGDYLKSIGLLPNDNSNDRTTPSGWANFVAERANNYLSNDGWNSQGDTSLPAALRNRYADTTNFVPANGAETPANNLPRALRWQPLMEESGSTGGFKAQVFNTPHLGLAKTLALTSTSVSGRNARPPYHEPDRNVLTLQDFLSMQHLLRNFFKLSRELTVQQRFLARWWENKRVSLLSFLPFYKRALHLSDWQETYIQLAQLIAMHDSVLVSWKEKRKHNSVRPTTMIKKFHGKRRIRVFISEDEGAGFILGNSYKPLFPVQSHPEYPSGSALLCTSALDALEAALGDIVGGSIPPYRMTATPGMFGFPHQQSIAVQYNSLREGAKECGQSRLWGGVHFPPSVQAAEELSRGIGLIAYKHVANLVNGTIPQNCKRCI